MINHSMQVNTPVHIAFDKGALAATLPGAINVNVVRNGVVTTIAPTATEVAPDVVSFSYTPTATGVHYLFVEDVGMVASLDVLTTSIAASLTTLTEVALGSWTLDKSTMVLTLFTQTGDPIATYDVVDTTDITSREKQ